jgi:hypothetical protein
MAVDKLRVVDDILQAKGVMRTGTAVDPMLLSVPNSTKNDDVSATIYRAASSPFSSREERPKRLVMQLLTDQRKGM